MPATLFHQCTTACGPVHIAPCPVCYHWRTQLLVVLGIAQVLAAMGASNAWGVGAQVIRRLPANMRKRILHRLDPGSAAQFLQVREPKPFSTLVQASTRVECVAVWCGNHTCGRCSACPSTATALVSRPDASAPFGRLCALLELLTSWLCHAVHQVLDPAEYIADCLEGVSALQKVRTLMQLMQHTMPPLEASNLCALVAGPYPPGHEPGPCGCSPHAHVTP